MLRGLLILVPGLFLAASANAGIVLTVENKADGQEFTTSLEKDRLHMVFPGATGIYRGDRKVFWFIREADRSYTEMTQDSLRQMSAAMQAARKHMEQALKSMPEAQRRQIEQQMAAMGGNQPRKTTSYRKTGKSDRVNGWRCEEVERLAGGEKTEDLCVARIAELGLKRDDLAVLSELEHFTSEMAGAAGISASSWDLDGLSGFVGYDALPVRTREDEGEYVLKSVKRVTNPPAIFEVPKGYSKRDMGLPSR